MRLLFLLAALTLAAVACGATSTSLVTEWGRPMNVQRVVVLYDAHDGAMRRTVEDMMTRKLSQRGIRAITSYAVLAPDEINDLARAKTALTEKGFDGVLVMRFVGKDEEPTGHDYFVNAYDDWGYLGGGFWSRYYASESWTVRVETSLYSLPTGELLWSARSRTSDADTLDVVDEVTTLIASTLERGGASATTARR